MRYPLLFMMFTGAVLWTGCVSQAEESQKDERIPVKTAAVIQKSIVSPVITSGILTSEAEMKLSFKTGGIVEKIFADEGTSAEKGQLLARLNLAEINAQVSQARSAYQKAERDLERLKRLYADSVVTLEQLQDATTALEVATANLEITEFNQQHSKIYAPSAGRILRRYVQVNELVQAGVPIFNFGTIAGGWIVRVGVSDRDVIRLQIGDSAQVFFDAYPGQAFRAEVSEIAEAADPRSGTFEIELTVEHYNHRLISGFVARTSIFPASHQRLTLIPVEALVEGNGTEGVIYALISAQQKAQRREIKIARLFEETIAVAAGLEGVTTVVTEGAAYLTDGAPVKVIDGLSQ